MAEGVPEEADAASPPEETGPAALSPGTRMAGYEIGRRLGVGSMGAVYEGVRVADERPVAIKLLAADLAGKPTARARFLNEATLTARVPHPHVGAIIDSGEESGRVYLVMDLLVGEDLARRLRRVGPMSVGEAIAIIGPVCDALAAAHRAGVTHRDLKPSNIFLATREERLHPMLLDFGVATDEEATGEGDMASVPSVPSVPTTAPTWNGVGTPMYLAPELVADHRAAGPPSDQYALGAVLYEMLTGEPPYAADNLPQLLQTIAAGTPPSARARRPELPPKLDALVLRAMSADPRGRFASVEELGRELRAFALPADAPEQPGRRRPPSSPSIAREAETPSPFVRTLVPEQEAKSGPWFVAPDADEIPEDEDQEEDELFDEDRAGDDLASAAETESGQLPEDPGSLDESFPVEDEGRSVEDQSPRVEATGVRAEDDRPADVASLPARTVPSIDWQAVAGFATKHRRILVPAGIAVLGIVLLFAIGGGHKVSAPVSIPPTASPVTVEKPAPAAPPASTAAERAEPAPPAPVALEKSELPSPAPAAAATVEKTLPPPAAVEKTEPAPAPTAAPTPAAAVEKTVPAPAATAAVEKREPAPATPAKAAAAVEKAGVAPAPAAAPVEAGDLAPAHPVPAATISTRTDRSKAAARRERPAPARAEAPLPKVASPAPAPKPRTPEGGTVRMHNGVPLLD